MTNSSTTTRRAARAARYHVSTLDDVNRILGDIVQDYIG